MFLEIYCRKFQELYGNLSCTFNLHLHGHLKQTFKDFGPPHASWCFAFERYNGILGSYHTNKKEIEPQIMKKFCQNQSVHSLELPPDQEFGSTLPDSYKPSTERVPVNSLMLLHMSQDPTNSIDSFAWSNSEGIVLLSPFYENVLDGDIAQLLENMYKELYPSRTIVHMSQFYRKFGRVKIAGDLVGSDMRGSNSHSSSVITAFWPSRGNCLNNIGRKNVGVIQYFMRHSYSYSTDENSEVKLDEHILAHVRWKEIHPCYDYYGISATVCVDLFEPLNSCCFIPVQRIASRCAYVTMPVNLNNVTETVFIACPIPFKYSV